MYKPLVSIICPVWNAEKHIQSTIESILSQTYENIEFVVVDGMSTDKTLSIINNYKERISHIVSEPDTGMYDALVKGFDLATGEIICYINAGDYLNAYAIEVAVSFFSNKHLEWITGLRSVCNENNFITHVDLPFRYKRNLIRSGSYGTSLPFIQQESTFWRRSLLNKVDYNSLKKLKYAGDYYLWWSFSQSSNLEVISCQLGVFKKHSGQLSANLNNYYAEMKSFVTGKSLLTYVSETYELFFWALSPKLRSFFYKSTYRFNHQTKNWEKSTW